MARIFNLEFTCTNNEKMHIVNAVKCNYNSNVDKFIRAGTKYTFELPATDEIINVICTGKGINAADMKIQSHFIKGYANPDDEPYTFSYCYNSFDKINFASFSYKQECNIYMSLNDVFK
jgi:hypothetical protein